MLNFEEYVDNLYVIHFIHQFFEGVHNKHLLHSVIARGYALDYTRINIYIYEKRGYWMELPAHEGNLQPDPQDSQQPWLL
jgi:hypothetical protein